MRAETLDSKPFSTSLINAHLALYKRQANSNHRSRNTHRLFFRFSIHNIKTVKLKHFFNSQKNGFCSLDHQAQKSVQSKKHRFRRVCVFSVALVRALRIGSRRFRILARRVESKPHTQTGKDEALGRVVRAIHNTLAKSHFHVGKNVH